MTIVGLTVDTNYTWGKTQQVVFMACSYVQKTTYVMLSCRCSNPLFTCAQKSGFESRYETG